ncbi:threonine dehydratase [Streptacidiphilus sp. MAP12-20]|uniref:pyridoxal-phosphate dependent enzyme n=1 Tax=Streptacidiphilus sp. MAP12-20 TaxID=3156299 RepID=UPI003516CEB4
MNELAYIDVKAAGDQIASQVPPVVLTALDPGAVRTAPVDPLDDREPRDCQVWLALEHGHTGSLTARGAMNFLATHHRLGTLPAAGIAIASDDNAALACAWAAEQHDVPATIFLPGSTPPAHAARLRAHGADVRTVGAGYGDALTACRQFTTATGALTYDTDDDPLLAAGAGTVLDEIRAQIPDLDTVVLAADSGLLTGVAAAARHHGIRAVAVEPLNSRRSPQTPPASLTSVLVSDQELAIAHTTLQDRCGITVGHGCGAPLAALLNLEPPTRPEPAAAGRNRSTAARSYRPAAGEKVAVILCCSARDAHGSA